MIPEPLSTSIAFALSDRASLPPQLLPDGFVGLHDIGTCAAVSGAKWVCFSPYHNAALLASAEHSEPVEPYLLTEVFPLRDARIPISTTIGFGPLEFAPVPLSAERPQFHAQWNAAEVQRTVDLRGVDLARYTQEIRAEREE